jgi:hypothetical protein
MTLIRQRGGEWRVADDQRFPRYSCLIYVDGLLYECMWVSTSFVEVW